MTLVDLISSAGERFGSAPALIVDDEVLTFRQLTTSAESLARGLLDAGIEPGDRLATITPNSTTWFALRSATALAGGITVALNGRLKSIELAQILRDCLPRFLFVRRFVGRHDILGRVLEAVALIEQDPPETYEPPLIYVEGWGSGLASSTRDWNELRRGPDARLDDELRRRAAGTAGATIANIQYTSGSTGPPKGVLLGHAQQVKNGRDFGVQLKLAPGDRFFSPGPFFHVAVGVALYAATVSHGSCLVTTAQVEADKVLDLLEAHACTGFYATSAVVSRMLASARLGAVDLTHLRKGWFAGSPHLWQQVYERLDVPGLTCMYGLSEASGVACSLPIDAPLDRRRDTNGLPLPGLRLSIRDPETGRALGPWESGEIVVHGYAVTLGYFGRASAQSADVAGGRLHTGDRGYLDADGYLHFQGRLRETLRIGGENVAPFEIEDPLRAHPDVVEAAVVGVADDDLVEVPFAFVELRESSRTSTSDLTAWLHERVADFKVPSGIRLVTQWPTTGSGKISRHDLAKMAAELRTNHEGDSGVTE